jgi:MFS family permease
MAISAAAGTVICLFGFEQGVFGGIIVGHEFQEYFRRPSLSPTGFVTSIYDLGCFAGALAALLVGEWLGQKRMLIDFTFIMAIVILIQTSASSINHFLWGRFIAGIGNGGNTATAPVWHVETSHQSAKGKAAAKEMVVNVLGFVVSNIITLAFSGLTTKGSVAVSPRHSTYFRFYYPCHVTYVA